MLLFSDRVKKINMYDWVQDRVIVITNEKVYNFKKTKIKRAIHIQKISGITKTLVQGKSEFVVHVLSEYDYRFLSDRYILR